MCFREMQEQLRDLSEDENNQKYNFLFLPPPRSICFCDVIITLLGP